MTRRAIAKRFGWAVVASASSVAWLVGCRASGEAPATHRADVTMARDGGAAGADGDGLPCDVGRLLVTRCQGCHSAQPSAPMPLVTHADLVAPSKSDPARKVFELALDRISSTTSPMPPSTPMGADEVALFSAWAKAGAPRANCVASGIDGGARDASVPECALASDCPGDLVCRSGFCDVECVTDKDCFVTWTCEETRCRPPEGPADAGPPATDGDL